MLPRAARRHSAANQCAGPVGAAAPTPEPASRRGAPRAGGGAGRQGCDVWSVARGWSGKAHEPPPRQAQLWVGGRVITDPECGETGKTGHRTSTRPMKGERHRLASCGYVRGPTGGSPF